MEYQRDEHRVHLIVYHLVWCLKRRKAVLGESIAKACQALIEQKCAEKDWKMLELAMQPDHIHLFVRVWPTDSAADVVQACKGLTAHSLRKKYAVLRRLPSLWTSSYCASTAGNVSQEIIQPSIAAQQGM
jgi:putative transposase